MIQSERASQEEQNSANFSFVAPCSEEFGMVLVCVTTVTMPVHLHGTNFVPFLLLTRRYYDDETSAILLLLKRAFA